MAVVINEFEVVAEPEHSGDTPNAKAEKGAAPESSTPRDMERVLRRLHARAARVRAD